jgi:hypothetical protein
VSPEATDRIQAGVETGDSGASERSWWQDEGYLAGREIGGGLWICVARMLFTFRLMVCDPGFVHDFYCYPDLADVLLAFADWDGTGDPVDGWVRHHGSGRRRPEDLHQDTSMRYSSSDDGD